MKEASPIPARNVRGKKTRNPGYEPGNHWVICDICASAIRAKDAKFRWDNAVVCPDDWEPRHPQDFVRGRQDKIRPDEPIRPEVGENGEGCDILNLEPVINSITVGTDVRYIHTAVGFGPDGWTFPTFLQQSEDEAFGSITDASFSGANVLGVFYLGVPDNVLEIHISGNRASNFFTSFTINGQEILSADAFFSDYYAPLDKTYWRYPGIDNPYSGVSIGETVEYTFT